MNGGFLTKDWDEFDMRLFKTLKATRFFKGNAVQLVLKIPRRQSYLRGVKSEPLWRRMACRWGRFRVSLIFQAAS